MSLIYWDSMAFIYLLEGNPHFLPKIQLMKSQMDRRGDTLVTSVFTLGEVLTGPRRAGATAAVETIKAYFSSGSMTLLPFEFETAGQYSILRSTFKVCQADALHLSCAAVAGVDAFVTNDKALWNLVVPGIRFIMDMDGNVH